MPLSGLIVADFSRVLAGPLAAMLLGDLGADVIKVERPGSGDDTRGWGPPFAPESGEATYFLGLNRNKRSVVLDLGDAGDRALARTLCERADVVIESFRPGLMAEWGLDRAALADANPRVITCAVRAFGSSEEAAELPGYDLLLQAMGGLMSITGEADGRPLKVGSAVVDLVCGLLAVIAIQAALVERERTGSGQHVEVTLMQAALAALLNQGSAVAFAGASTRRRGNAHPSIAPYETFDAADRPFALAVGNDRLFERLCAAIGTPELADEPCFATNADRVNRADALREILQARFAAQPAAHWIELLRAARVPVGPINDIGEAFELARSLAIDPTAPPLSLDRTPPSVRRPPPRLDEHGEEIRDWLRR